MYVFLTVVRILKSARANLLYDGLVLKNISILMLCMLSFCSPYCASELYPQIKRSICLLKVVAVVTPAGLWLEAAVLFFLLEDIEKYSNIENRT